MMDEISNLFCQIWYAKIWLIILLIDGSPVIDFSLKVVFSYQLQTLMKSCILCLLICANLPLFSSMKKLTLCLLITFVNSLDLDQA